MKRTGSKSVTEAVCARAVGYPLLLNRDAIEAAVYPQRAAIEKEFANVRCQGDNHLAALDGSEAVGFQASGLRKLQRCIAEF